MSIAGCSRHLAPGERNNYHPYGVARATLHLEYFGETRGTESLFIDGFGTREAHNVHSELITEKGFRPTITYSVRSGSNLTVVDSVKQIEVRLIDRIVDSLYHLSPGDVPTPEQQSENIFLHLGFELIGDTTILGLNAHIFQKSVSPFYIFEWRGLVIGNKSQINGHLNELRLLSIDTVSAIDPARFMVPHGFPVQDLTKLKPGDKIPEPK